MSDIQAFLLGQGPDNKGRFYSSILTFDDQMWDECHDFIQWLFPLPVESKHARFSPVLTHQDIEDLWNNSVVQINLINFANRFCSFLGINIFMPSGAGLDFLTGGKCFTEIRFRVSLSNNFSDQAKYWLRANDHNHLRINRMLQCLVLFGLENLAKAIFRCLVMIKCEFDDCITDETMVYWRNALTGYSY